jgi:hypothetical protein
MMRVTPDTVLYEEGLMFSSFRRVFAIGTGAIAIALVLAPVAAAQVGGADTWHNAHRLGGSAAFYTPPLKTADGLKRMAAKKGLAEDIRTMLRESGIPETSDAVLAAFAGATASVKGGSCSDATPADGIIVECKVEPGSTLLWMAYRPRPARGRRVPGRLERVRWAGNKPFDAFLFRVTNDYKIYTFIVPKACGNLSLMSVKEIEGEPVSVSVDRVCEPSGTLRETVRASSRDLARVQRVSVAINGQPAGEMTAPSWTFASNKPGDYTFDATDTRGRPYVVTPRTAHVDACPAPPEPPRPPTVVRPTCSMALSSARVKVGWEITVNATRCTTGTSDVAPAVTVELRDDAGVVVGQALTLDASLTGKFMVRKPGAYRATATVSTPRTVESGGNRYEGTVTCDEGTTIEKPVGHASVFIDALGGKDRRVRPVDGRTTVDGGPVIANSGATDFAQCSPLIGVKLGVSKRFHNDWEIAGAAGVAFSLVNDDNKVREHEVMADIEANKYLNSGMFLGTGLSLWDLTHSDTFTPAWMLHFGVPLGNHPKHQVYFLVEGRLFFDHIDDVQNNYQFWGGVRVHFGK